MYNDVRHLNKVINKLEQGKLVTGIAVFSLEFANARYIIQYNGYPSQEDAINRPMIDFIFIEMEHAPFDVTKLKAFLRGLISPKEILAKGNLQPNVATFVRLPCEGREQVHAIIKQVLDIGVHGIVIPHVRTPEEVLNIVKSCRYPRPDNCPYREPNGNRGASPNIAAFQWGLTNAEYVEHADVWPLNPNGDIFIIIMVEDVEGANNIEEIVKVPGIGAVFFGSYDYSFSAGKFGDMENNVVRDAYNKVKNVCDKADIPFIGYGYLDNIARLLEEKYKMLIIGLDVEKSGNADKVLNYLKNITQKNKSKKEKL